MNNLTMLPIPSSYYINIQEQMYFKYCALNIIQILRNLLIKPLIFNYSYHSMTQNSWQALFVVSVLKAKPIFVVSVLMAKPVFVVSVGFRVFQKNLKFTIFLQSRE